MDYLVKDKAVSTLEKIGWHEFLCKTNFSFLMGASHPEACLKQAEKFNYKALAINDFDGAYGLARSHLVWTKNNASFPLLHGAEIHFEHDHDLPLLKQDTLCLLTQSKTGYKNLCEILSHTHRHTKTNAFILLEDLRQFSLKDVIAIHSTRGLIRKMGPNQSHLFYDRCKTLKEIFPGQFYLALTKLLHPSEDCYNDEIADLAKLLKIPTIFSQDIFFHCRSEKRLSDLMQTIRKNLTLAESVGYFFPNTERSFHTLQELARLYGRFPGFESTLLQMKDLAESCHFNMSELKYTYPREFLPQGKTSLGFLTEITWDSAKARYQNIPENIKKLLEHELHLIETLGFADYFLTVWDIVRWAKEQKILCQGRGSAANSAVCYVLGVTNVDPMQFDVLFERFISVERGDPPDIDVDFEHERREEVIQYVYKRYGRNRAAMVANVICFKKKSALRAAGKALGISEDILKDGSQYLEVRQFRKGATAATVEAVAKNPDKDREIPLKTLTLWAEFAEKIYGFPRHLGLHSGGVILSNEPLNALVPQEPASMTGRTCIQWCKEDIEGLGFFKVDLLALGMLTALRKIFDLLNKNNGVNYSLDSIPSNDPKTYAMIQKAKTVGTFQIESRAQMSMLPRLRPEKFYDLVIEIAIIRPGPIIGKMVHPYLKRRRGLEKEIYPNEKLIPILKRTLGVPIFQEQVMRIAMAVGDFTAGEANELRKNIGSFSIKGDVGKWIPKLKSGMKKNGISEEFTEQLVSQLQGFSAYGFPESHAVSFAHLAYASCFLKAHFAPAFYASIINSQPMGFYSVHVLLQTAKAEGIKIKPVCVLNSDWDTTLEADGDSLQGWSLRLGFRQVTALSQNGAQKYLSRRQSWKNIADFLQHCGLSRVDLTALAAADGLQIFAVDRRTAVWLSEAAPYNKFLEDVEKDPEFRPLSESEKIQMDFNTFKTTLGAHPVEVIRKDAWNFEVDVSKVTSAIKLPTKIISSTVYVFGMVLVRQSPPTAKGMVFITMEDETGMINLVFTPQVYDQFQKLIDFKGLIFAEGKLQNDSGSISILVRKVYAPELKTAEILTLQSESEFIPIRNYM